MKALTSGKRTIKLSTAAFAGHTVRIAHSLIGLAGAAMVSCGAAMIYNPAGWICGGAFLLLLAFELSAVAGRRRPIETAAPEGD